MNIKFYTEILALGKSVNRMGDFVNAVSHKFTWVLANFFE